jgi:hypothetical protein
MQLGGPFLDYEAGWVKNEIDETLSADSNGQLS